MKAIILAGGEGTRLRPLSLLSPKPMLPLFDRPLLAHLIELLRRSGFTELCITVRYLSQQIIDWFGDGSEFGVSILYEEETAPLGTAGSVRQCASFIGQDDFLVISGDAALDLDLCSFWENHRLHGGSVSILLYHSTDPMEFGLVMTDKDQCVSSFLEKPSRADVCSDLVNTGIYAFSADILSRIPDGKPYDFGTDLFPALLQSGIRIHTFQAKGYWNDVGNCAAYLQTCRDVLDGILRLPLLGQVNTTDKTWVSPDAFVEHGVQLLPYSVIGGGSILKTGCRIENSVLLDSHLEPDCYVSGSILGSHVRAKANSRILDGSVLGDNTILMENQVLSENSTIWPAKTIGTTAENASRYPVFQIDGSIHIEKPELSDLYWTFRAGFCNMGVSRIAVSGHGGAVAEQFVEAFLSGCRLSGKEVVRFDAAYPSAAALLSGFFCFPITVFIQQTGKRLFLYFFNQSGTPISRKQQRKLEQADVKMLPICWNPQPVQFIHGAMQIYYRLAAPNAVLDGITIAADTVCQLQDALTFYGAKVVPPADGILFAGLAADGFRVFLRDETGHDISHTELLALYILLTKQDGSSAIRVPWNTSPMIERLAARMQEKLLRDVTTAAVETEHCPAVLDGLSLLIAILSAVSHRKVRLSELREMIPPYYQEEYTMETQNNTGRILRELSAKYHGRPENGLHLTKDNVHATLTPLSQHRLRILLESEKAEFAREFSQELQSFLK